MDNKERRQFPKRAESVNLVYFAVLGEKAVRHQGMGRTLNISQGGLLLETREKIPEMEKVVLTLGLEHETLDIEAQAVRFLVNSDGTVHTGFSFKVKENERILKLKKYIDLFESKYRNE